MNISFTSIAASFSIFVSAKWWPMNDITWRNCFHSAICAMNERHETRYTCCFWRTKLYFRNTKHQTEILKIYQSIIIWRVAYVECIIPIGDGRCCRHRRRAIGIVSWIMCLPAHRRRRYKFNIFVVVFLFSSRIASWIVVCVRLKRLSLCACVWKTELSETEKRIKIAGRTEYINKRWMMSFAGWICMANGDTSFCLYIFCLSLRFRSCEVGFGSLCNMQ